MDFRTSRMIATSCVINMVVTVPAGTIDAGAKWTVYVEGEASPAQAVDLLPATTPVENYTENLARIWPEMTREEFEDSGEGNWPHHTRTLTPPYEPSSQAVTEIGTWYGHTVFDVHNDAARHRSIVLKDESGNHRILYTQTCWASAGSDPPYIVSVQDENVLEYRSYMGGTGGFLIEYYFVFDSDSRRPVALSLDPIEAKLKEILPKGKAVWKGGGFDIATLSYNHTVWQEGDGNCCPTAGQVGMKLEVRKNALVVVESNYDPKAPRE